MIVKLQCSNPECRKWFDAYVKKGKECNRYYCNSKCYSSASPSALAAFSKYDDIENYTLSKFKELLANESEKFSTKASFAEFLGVSRFTLASWFKKYSIDNKFSKSLKRTYKGPILKKSELSLGDKIMRVCDHNKRVFEVTEITKKGIKMVSDGGVEIFLQPRVLKIFYKLDK